MVVSERALVSCYTKPLSICCGFASIINLNFWFPSFGERGTAVLVGISGVGQGVSELLQYSRKGVARNLFRRGTKPGDCMGTEVPQRVRGPEAEPWWGSGGEAPKKKVKIYMLKTIAIMC